MRSALLLFVVACSSKEPANEKVRKNTEPPPPPPSTNKLEKVTATDKVQITKVSFLPLGTLEDGPQAGHYSVSWEVSRTDGLASGLGAHVKCRMHDQNLVVLFSGGSERASFYPDPHAGAKPEACEVRWFVTANKTNVIARACYRDRTLTDGACPAGTFPAPKMPAGMDVDFKIVPSPKRFKEPVPLFQLDDNSVRFNATATIASTLEREPFSILRCSDGANVVTSVEPQAHKTLALMEAGETLYGWDWIFFLEKTPQLAKLDRCELEFLAGDPKAKAKTKSLGTFCIVDKAGGMPEATPGACNPPLPTRAKQKAK